MSARLVLSLVGALAASAVAAQGREFTSERRELLVSIIQFNGCFFDPAAPNEGIRRMIADERYTSDEIEGIVADVIARGDGAAVENGVHLTTGTCG